MYLYFLNPKKVIEKRKKKSHNPNLIENFVFLIFEITVKLRMIKQCQFFFLSHLFTFIKEVDAFKKNQIDVIIIIHKLRNLKNDILPFFFSAKCPALLKLIKIWKNILFQCFKLFEETFGLHLEVEVKFYVLVWFVRRLISLAPARSLCHRDAGKAIDFCLS